MAALCLTRAYRSVSDDAALVLADVVPVDLMAKEMAHKYVTRVSGLTAEVAESRTKEIQEDTLRSWQEQWTPGTRKRHGREGFSQTSGRGWDLTRSYGSRST